MHKFSRWQKLVNDAEIHRMAQSKDAGERQEALDELRNNFVFFNDKDQAWKDLQALKYEMSYACVIQIRINLYQIIYEETKI